MTNIDANRGIVRYVKGTFSHRCFMQKVKQLNKGSQFCFVFSDLETRQDDSYVDPRREDHDDIYEHKPILCVSQLACHICSSQPKTWLRILGRSKYLIGVTFR